MNIIVPISGGKDSTACLIKALKTSDNVVAVFNDTGWDHPTTYEYIDYLRDTLNIDIHTTTGGKRGKDLVSLIRDMGKFPFGLGRFCTMYLKQYALRDWYKDNIYDGNTHYEVWFGMRTGESAQRARKYAGLEPEDLFDMEDIFPNRWNKKLRATLQCRLPVVTWTEDEVFNYIESNGIKRNPLYFEGTNDRVGCYPCMLASKKVQAEMFKTKIGKERLEIIKGLEKELGVKYEMHDTDQGSCEICKI
jgi:3'-phosphoadenosine 5'-phosphosulfate sulfotransferase (PAPS reductase)/FAD synthetase